MQTDSYESATHYDPQMMLATLLYACRRGSRSSQVDLSGAESMADMGNAFIQVASEGCLSPYVAAQLVAAVGTLARVTWIVFNRFVLLVLVHQGGMVRGNDTVYI